MVKKICDKKIGNIDYIINYFESDNKYVIYRWNKKNNQIHQIPEVADFNNEKDAKEYLDKL
jgi:hypothetical protein